MKEAQTEFGFAKDIDSHARDLPIYDDKFLSPEEKTTPVKVAEIITNNDLTPPGIPEEHIMLTPEDVGIEPPEGFIAPAIQQPKHKETKEEIKERENRERFEKYKLSRPDLYPPND